MYVYMYVCRVLLSKLAIIPYIGCVHGDVYVYVDVRTYICWNGMEWASRNLSSSMAITLKN